MNEMLNDAITPVTPNRKTPITPSPMPEHVIIALGESQGSFSMNGTPKEQFDK